MGAKGGESRRRRKTESVGPGTESSVGRGSELGGMLSPKEIRARASRWAESVKGLGAHGIMAEHAAVKEETERAEGLSWKAFDRAPASKKRYPTVLVWDHNRVVLKTRPPADDFIHASYVEGGGKPKKWIITQGPLADTVRDFWEMVWEEGVGVLVMLCLVREGKSEKCFQYWPEEEGKAVELGGDLTVTTERSWQDQPLIDAQEIQVTSLWLSRAGDRRRLYHYQYRSWADLDAPNSPKAVIHLGNLVRGKQREMVAEEKVGLAAPIVVHCSAGVGRSGTFVCLDNAMTALSLPGQDQASFSLKRLAMDLRRQRFQAIQTPRQYLFIYQALLSHLKTKKLVPANTPVPSEGKTEAAGEPGTVNTAVPSGASLPSGPQTQTFGRPPSRLDQSHQSRLRKPIKSTLIRNKSRA